MISFVSERLHHRHIRLQIVQNLLLTAILLLTGCIMACLAGSGSLFARLFLPTWLAFGTAAAVLALISASRRLLLGILLLSAMGLTVQSVLAQQSGSGWLELAAQYILCAAFLLAGLGLAHLLTQHSPLMLYGIALAGIFGTGLIMAIRGSPWIQVFGLSIQLSELFRLLSIIAIAASFSIFSTTSYKIAMITLLLSVTALFSLLCGELATFLVILLAAGLTALVMLRDIRPVAAGAALAVLLLAGLLSLAQWASDSQSQIFPLVQLAHIYDAKLKPRLLMLFQIELLDPYNEGFQVRTARKALFLTRAFGISLPALNVPIPVSGSDFILIVLASILGVFPTVFALTLAGLSILWSALVDSRDPYGGISAALAAVSGYTFFAQLVLALQSGSGWGLVTGLSIPFVGAGGSSLAAFGAMAGFIAYGTSGFCRCPPSNTPSSFPRNSCSSKEALP